MAELPKIVVQKLRGIDAGTSAHPEPDLLNAFVERALTPPEREQVMQHLASCGDCREVLALAFPPRSEANVSAPVAASPWLSWPVLRWGALAACIVVVFAAVSLRNRSTTGRTHLVQQNEVSRYERAENPATAAEPSRKRTENAKTSQPFDVAQNTPPAPLELKKKEAVAGVAQPAALDKTLRAAPVLAADNKVQGAGGQAAGVMSASGAPATEARDDLVPGRAKDVAPVPATSEVAAQAGTNMAAKAQIAVSAAEDRNAPSALRTRVVPRWTLSADGTLQRSQDGGRSWQTIPVPSQATFRALASNGFDIWIGGTRGSLFHSADGGQNWIPIQPAANGETLSDDIIGVEFTDLSHGAVTTSSSETWVTADAGRSWQKQ